MPEKLCRTNSVILNSGTVNNVLPQSVDAKNVILDAT